MRQSFKSQPLKLLPPMTFMHGCKAKTLRVQETKYERYTREPILQVSSALGWWLDPVHRSRFPQLSRLAADLLSIPAFSAEPERLFSNARRTLSDDRNCLEIDMIETLECLKSWLKSEILDSTSIENLA